MQNMCHARGGTLRARRLLDQNDEQFNMSGATSERTVHTTRG